VKNKKLSWGWCERARLQADWFFAEDDSESLPVPAVLSDAHEESEPANNQALLLDNISKYEGEWIDRPFSSS
jgi:hypothetical protein